MRQPSALDAMRSRLQPCRTVTDRRLQELTARLPIHVARKVLDEEDLLDALLLQCERHKVPISVDDLAAIFVVQQGQEAYELCFSLITIFGDDAGLELILPYQLGKVIERGRELLGLPNEQRKRIPA